MESALEIIRCPTDPGHERDGKRLTNLTVVLPDSEVQDFVCTWYSELLIQTRALQVLKSVGITGFEVEPVVARFEKSSERPPELWELRVTGWAGIAKPESGIHLDEALTCRVCGHLRYTGLANPEQLIDEKTWDGSDFFMVWPMPRYVFVTEQVAAVVRDYHLTGVKVVPVGELKKTDGFTPGRLHYYMPEDRARQLGEPLGIY